MKVFILVLAVLLSSCASTPTDKDKEAGKKLNIKINESLNGTTILNTYALIKNANILRVHDVKEAKECVNLLQELK